MLLNLYCKEGRVIRHRHTDTYYHNIINNRRRQGLKLPGSASYSTDTVSTCGPSLVTATPGQPGAQWRLIMYNGGFLWDWYSPRRWDKITIDI